MEPAGHNLPMCVARVARFEALDVTVMDMNGATLWSSRQIATALGYADASEVMRRASDDWSAELVEGVDYRVLRGEDLAALKAAAPGLVAPRAPSLLMLTESGVHLVCLLSHKPAAKKLRRWLAEEVLPSLHRTGRYEIAAPSPATPAPAGLSVDRIAALTEAGWEPAQILAAERLATVRDLLAQGHAPKVVEDLVDPGAAARRVSQLAVATEQLSKAEKQAKRRAEDETESRNARESWLVAQRIARDGWTKERLTALRFDDFAKFLSEEQVRFWPIYADWLTARGWWGVGNYLALGQLILPNETLQTWAPFVASWRREGWVSPSRVVTRHGHEFKTIHQTFDQVLKRQNAVVVVHVESGALRAAGMKVPETVGRYLDEVDRLVRR